MRQILLQAPIALFVAAAAASLAGAQINTPPASPTVKVSQQVGLGTIELDYSRPSVRDREIFGGLQEWGVVWRTGANAATKITFSEDATVGGVAVEAGTYAIFSIPMEKGPWTFIMNSNADQSGTGSYDPALDVVRIEVEPTKLAATQESLTLDFQGFHANGADLTFAWADTSFSVPIMVDTTTRVMKQIDEEVRNAKGEVDAQTYYKAGSFLYAEKTDLDDAAKWIDKAVELSPGAFWMKYTSAELAHHMGDMDKAKTMAAACLEQAKASERGDFGYAARAEALLAKLK